MPEYIEWRDLRFRKYFDHPCWDADVGEHFTLSVTSGSLGWGAYISTHRHTLMSSKGHFDTPQEALDSLAAELRPLVDALQRVTGVPGFIITGA